MIPTSINESTILNDVSSVTKLYQKLHVAMCNEFSPTRNLKELSTKLHTSLNRLFAFPVPVWLTCKDLIASNETEHAFVVVMMAFRSLDVSKIKIAVEFCLQDAIGSYAGSTTILNALLTMPDDLAGPWVERFIRSKDLEHKYIAIEYFSAKGVDPSSNLRALLEREDIYSHERLVSSVLRIIGEQKLSEFKSVLSKPLIGGSSPVAFWALWSTILLGDSARVVEMENFVSCSGAYQDRAIDMFFRVASVDLAYRTIAKMRQLPGNNFALIQAAQILGDTKAVPWLIGLMPRPEYAQMAARAFSIITGVDLEKKGLTLDIPLITALQFRDRKPRANTTIRDNTQDYLLWPDIEKIKVTWQHYGDQYQVGKRYYRGRSLSVDRLQLELSADEIGIRKSAAMELALLMPQKKLVNTMTEFH